VVSATDSTAVNLDFLDPELKITLALNLRDLDKKLLLRATGNIILTTFLPISGSRDTSVGVATGWMTTVRIPTRESFSSSPKRPDRLWTHSASYSMDTSASFSRDKAAGA
jgi:hypothetical protein